MANKAQLSRIPYNGYARLAAANTAGDGSGTIAALVTFPFRTTKVANISSSANVVVSGWSRMSNDNVGQIVNGDTVNLLAGTSLSSIALNTDYTISGLTVDSTTDIATFQLLDSSYAQLTISATNPVFGFVIGGRIEQTNGIASQATKGVLSGKVLSAYIRPRNLSYRKLFDLAITAHTPSTTVIATLFTQLLAYPFQSGDTIGVSITVYGGAADQTDVISISSSF